jgi:hypothetical protein
VQDVKHGNLVELAENGKASQVRQATGEYINGLDTVQLRNYVHAAAYKALAGGDGAAQWRLKGTINGPQAYGNYLQEKVRLLLFDEPRIFAFFSPDFNAGVLSRVS